MFTTTPTFTLVSALVGASAYAPEVPVAAVQPIPWQAVADIRRARVEIYCGHNARAVARIRAAREQLLRVSAAVVPAATLVALDQAARLTRKNQYQRAELALEDALAHMTQDSGLV